MQPPVRFRRQSPAWVEYDVTTLLNSGDAGITSYSSHNPPTAWTTWESRYLSHVERDIRWHDLTGA
jgi:hypothetical protein